MKVVVDMNLSPEWVAYLNDQGWEAGHWSQLGDPTAPDREILVMGGVRTAVKRRSRVGSARLLDPRSGRHPKDLPRVAR